MLKICKKLTDFLKFSICISHKVAMDMNRKSSLTAKVREKQMQQHQNQQQKQHATSPGTVSTTTIQGGSPPMGSQRRSVSPSGPQHPFTDRPLGEYADVSRSLSELKEQMKRLSMDHQRLQEQVLAQSTAPQRNPSIGTCCLCNRIFYK